MERALDPVLRDAALAVFALVSFTPLELCARVQTAGRYVRKEWLACALRTVECLAQKKTCHKNAAVYIVGS